MRNAAAVRPLDLNNPLKNPESAHYAASRSEDYQ
jgi:hypothetical protein